MLDSTEAYVENSMVSFNAEKGASYLIRISQNTTCSKDTFTLSASKGLSVTGLQVKDESCTIVYGEMIYDLDIELSYSDDSVKELTLTSSQTRDSYGNSIVISLKDYERKIGTYTGTVSCGEFSDSVTVNVISRLFSSAASSYPDLGLKQAELAEGAVTASADLKNGKAYLKITADVTGDYTFSIETENIYGILFDKNENSVGSRQVYLKAGEPYLLVFENEYEMEDIMAVVSWTWNTTSIKSISLNTPEKFYDGYIMNTSSEMTITYSNGETETIPSLLESTDDGRYLSVVLTSSEGKEYSLFDLCQTKNYGTYRLTVSYGDVSVSKDVEYTFAFF